ncbi:isochorismatase family protein [Dehalobacterium formicoaceticum]|uniref:Isochorismatase family protein n=1 Tax=Dehalobacterium formicoaceticum TaxID=51515 RepID=A0ABT1Y2N9_9FIRM|nr:isochorismatase family protein [Dehalobacterium formicoaceticum]MCR6545130.1 isochorismatase family protein [Dehalobacterium formicoaceticum]
MKTIKSVAEITGLTPKSIRGYESFGLIHPPKRTKARYRLYSEDDINRLLQIKHYRTLKFSLSEIAVLLNSPPLEIEASMIKHLRFLDEQLNEYHYAKAMICSTLYNRKKNSLHKLDINHRVAIIAIDLQNDMLEGGALQNKRMLTILPPLQRLFAQARREGIPIIYICDSHEKGDPELEIWDEHMMEGTYGAQIIDDVAPADGDFIIKKSLFNGFINTDLQYTLELLDIDTLLFTGWRTDVCVAQTAIEAFYRGYKVVIAKDGVNTTTQSAHDFGMSLMGINYDFTLCTCEDFTKTLIYEETLL